MPRTALVPVFVLLVCIVPLATTTPWTPVFFLVPLAAAGWVLRVGVDVDDAGVTARSTLGSRTVPWTDLAGIRIGRRRDLRLVTTSGTEIGLPGLRARDLPRLAAASGGRIPAPQQGAFSG